LEKKVTSSLTVQETAVTKREAPERSSLREKQLLDFLRQFTLINVDNCQKAPTLPARL